MQYDAHECLLQLLGKIYPNINDDCMFKINKLESTLCNDRGHTAINDGVCIDWSLHLEDSSNVQTISGMLHQLMDSKGEYLENYSCVDGCQKLNTSTKAVYAIEEISLWGNRMVHLVLFIIRENSLIAVIIHQELTWITSGF